MGFVNGNMKSTRFTVVSLPPSLDFQAAAFTEIQPGSNLRQKSGFVPFDLYDNGQPHYQLGQDCYAFRFRTDQAIIDQGLLNEKMGHQIRLDLHAGLPVGMKRRKLIRTMIEQELMESPAIKTRIVEGVIENGILYLDTVSKSQLGEVLEYLKRIGVEVEYLTPWQNDPEPQSNFLDLKEPGQSAHGCIFMAELIQDPTVLVEPEKGSVKLIGTDGVKVSLSGSVLNMMDEALQNGAHILSAKILFDLYALNFDALAYRIKSVKIEKSGEKHWSEKLLDRLERLKTLWSMLDDRYAAMKLSSTKT